MRSVKKEIWVIRNKLSGELWKARSGKISWRASSHAKNAWANSNCGYRSEIPYFDDQDEYELVNINEELGTIFGKALSLMERVLPTVDDPSLVSEIEKFLEENKCKV